MSSIASNASAASRFGMVTTIVAHIYREILNRETRASHSGQEYVLEASVFRHLNNTAREYLEFRLGFLCDCCRIYPSFYTNDDENKLCGCLTADR